jgi:hypothetical protein
VQHHAVRRNLPEHHEVIKVPVQHTRQLQLTQRTQFNAQCPAAKPELRGHADQLLEVHAFHRRRKALTQRKKVAVLSMVTGNHGHARQTAFSGFGLQHHRQFGSNPESERIFEVQRRFPIPRKGSSSHS